MIEPAGPAVISDVKRLVVYGKSIDPRLMVPVAKTGTKVDVEVELG